MSKRIVPVVLATALMVHSCAMTSDSLTTALDGSAWILAGLPPDDLLDGVTGTLAFDGDSVAGSDGCNRFRGSYSVEGDTLRFGQLAGTMMACPEPVMLQAKRFMAAMEAARSARIENGRLSLLDAAGESVASFDEQSQSLANTRWTVTGYNNGKGGVVSIAAETSLTLEFDDAGTVSGSAGCNNFRAGYVVDGSSIEFQAPAATRKLCPDEIMQQEQLFLEALPRGTTLRFEADKLELRDDQGALQISARQMRPGDS